MPARTPTTRAPRRRGTILPLLTVTLIALMGFVALAIDIGMVAMARTQCQNAADAAAMTGARALNGNVNTNNNYANAGPAAVTAATNNSVLSQPITTSQVNITIGSFAYDSNANAFVIHPTARPPATTGRWPSPR